MIRLALLAGCIMLPSIARADNGSAAIAWLRHNATVITSTDPAAPDKDLAQIDAMVGSARLLGAGEATHGAREFFRMKDRLFRHLVVTKGFTGFAIEANYADADAINVYVHGGQGEPEALIARLGFWTWDTEEVLDLVSWMRAWNDTHARKLSFYGIDIQYAPSNLAIALDFLDEAGVQTKAWRGLLSPYLAVADTISNGYRATNGYTPSQMAGLRDATAKIVQAFDDERASLVAARGADAYLRARAGALAGAWYFVMQSRQADWRFTGFRLEYDVRDRAMADLAEAALEREGPAGKVFIWAHNAHVTKALQGDGRMTMGRYLAEDRRGYVSLGMAFDHGGFQAFPPPDPNRPTSKPTLSAMDVGPAPANYAEAVLRRGPGPIWIADLRALVPGTPAQGWFATAQHIRWTGSDYSPDLMSRHAPINLAESHDLLLFITSTTRARPLANTRTKQGIVKSWP